MDGIAHRYATLSSVKMHYVEAGSGAPLVLLHGYPETWYEWRHVIPLLAPNFRVIAPDLRGLGDTSRPAHGYDKRTVAGDVRELLRDHLKLDTIGLVGHDWGGPTAYALTRLDPALVKRLAIIDVVIPGDGRPGGIAQGGARWHHGFHRTPHLPEALTAGREAIYLSYFYDEYVSVAGAITSADIAEYARTYAQPGAMRCGFEFYRATDEDARVNAEELSRLGNLPIPVLGIAGGAGRGRGPELEESLRRVADDPRCHVLPGVGHMVPEEAPEQVAALLGAFFAP
jgi:pimeloyl-ACP methyl ester carboxylesterase